MAEALYQATYEDVLRLVPEHLAQNRPLLLWRDRRHHVASGKPDFFACKNFQVYSPREPDQPNVARSSCVLPPPRCAAADVLLEPELERRLRRRSGWAPRELFKRGRSNVLASKGLLAQASPPPRRQAPAAKKVAVWRASRPFPLEQFC